MTTDSPQPACSDRASDVAEPCSPSTSASTTPSTFAPRPNGRAGTREAGALPARDAGEYILDYVARPDVAPFVRSVSLVRVSTADDTGRPLRDPPIRFGHPPTMTEVLDRITVPGHYACYAHGDRGAFIARETDMLLNITEGMLDDREAARERASQVAADEAEASAGAAGESEKAIDVLQGIVERQGDDLRAVSDAREADRQRYAEETRELTREHSTKVERLAAEHDVRGERASGAHADQLAQLKHEHAEQIAALKSEHADKLADAKAGTRDGTAMDGFTKAAEIFGGSSMDLKTSEAIRDKAHAEGHTAGMVEGKATAYAEARAAARAELGERSEELDKRKADLERREAKNEKAIAGASEGAEERAAELDARQAKLDDYAKRLGTQTAAYKEAAAKVGGARQQVAARMRDLDAREADVTAREDTMMTVGDPRTAAIAAGAMEVDPDEPYGDEFDDLLDTMGVGDEGRVAEDEYDAPPTPPVAAAAPATPATPVVPATDPTAERQADQPLNPPTAEELLFALGPD